MKKSIILSVIIIIGVYYSYNIATKTLSPFKEYAATIPHSYRMGFFNLETELAAVPLKTEGTIPSWLSGTLLRNGPAQFTTQNSWVTNWFDGLAMIHAFVIDNGTITYSNKFLHGDDYKHVQKTGKMNYEGFMQDPCGSIFKNIASWFFEGKVRSWPLMPNANVNIVPYNNKIAALTEIPLPIHFDPQTLETLGALSYTDKLPITDIHDTAHPHYDPEHQQHISYFTQFGRTSTINLVRIPDATTTRQVIASYTMQEPSYMHSFAITKQYAILTALPFVVNPIKLLRGTAFINNFTWKPTLGTRLVVIDRHTGKFMGTYITTPFFAFHTVNAYEDNNRIILDVVAYPDASILKEGLFCNLLNPQHNPANNAYSQLHRYIIDLTTSTVTDTILSTDFVELPRINYAYNGKQYHHVYMVGQSKSPYVADKLIAHNLTTKKAQYWKEDNCFPSEPIFIARPEANMENDGVILSIVLDSIHKRSFLLVLDGQTFKEIARAYAPHIIPFGIHGYYAQDRIYATKNNGYGESLV